MELLKIIAAPTATIVASIFVAVVGSLLTRHYAARRDAQDRESQWRNHALELTKLDLQRRIAARRDGDKPLRPSILDFLANYRDLAELGTKSPRELYEDIYQKRISAARGDEGQAN